ncbi:MAG: DNA polymerase III subunit delta' [Oscillospiraceae bacterium]
MIKLYSKDSLVSAVTAMKSSGRMAHAFLLTGERGAGKKISADYIAMTLLCENGNACGECRHCRRILSNSHPDVIKPEKSGKKQIYNVETMRFVCSDAYVAPNDCDAKVYIFTDCESIEERTQNLMLKLIEEPPDTAYFIFTAVSRSVFLPTILSRVITIGIPECSEDECRAALADMGFAASDINEAVECCHGNIGSCVEYLNGGETAENIALCREIIAAIASGNEYGLLTALHKIGENRSRIKLVLELADKVIRDACVMRLGTAPLIGCDPKGAELLSRKISVNRAEAIHEAIGRTVARCGMNMNVPPEMAALACAVMG